MLEEGPFGEYMLEDGPIATLVPICPFGSFIVVIGGPFIEVIGGPAAVIGGGPL